MVQCHVMVYIMVRVMVQYHVAQYHGFMPWLSVIAHVVVYVMVQYYSSCCGLCHGSIL